MTNPVKLFDKIDTVLLDLDGTIYLSDELIEGADTFLKELKAQGKECIFLTNNSSKNSDNYVEKLKKIGIRASKEQIFTSGEATAIYLNNHFKYHNIYLLGTSELAQIFEDYGYHVVKEEDENVDAVILGFDTGLTYDKLWRACELLAENKPYFATHPDLNCPLKDGKYKPDAGAIMACIEASTGRKPIIIGKPNSFMLESLEGKYGIKRERTLMIGDRLYTDMKLAENTGIRGWLVFSGETKPRDLRNNSIGYDLAFESVKELIQYI